MNSGTFAKLIIIATLLLLLPASQAAAADITTSATCTLAQAWASALANSDTEGCVAVGAYGDDTIILHANAATTQGLQLFDQGSSSITVDGKGFTINATRRRHFITRNGGTLNLKNVKLTGGSNTATASIDMLEGANPAAVNIENSVICDNETTTTGFGGTIYVSRYQPFTIRNSIVCNNTILGQGGAINAQGPITVINSVFYGNSAGAEGGAIYLNSNAGTSKIYHTTITNNSAPNGSGLYLGLGNLEIRNSIIHGNTGSHDCRIQSNHVGTVTASGVLVGTSTCGNKLTPVSTADPRLIDRTGAAYSIRNNAVYSIPHYALSADSPARAARTAAACLTGDAAVPNDLLGRSRPTSGNCDLGAVVYVPPPATPIPTDPPAQQPASDDNGNGNGGGGRGRGGGGDSAAMAPTPVRLSPPDTCARLFPEIQVTNRSAGTNCQRVSGWAIGHPDLIAAHPDRVVDVWGWITPETQVCFPAQSGRIRFIDTTAMPRTLAPLPAFKSGDKLCAHIDRAGQVALIADGSPPATNQDQPPTNPTPEHGAKPLSDCMVRAKYSLNLRDAPAGERVGGVQHNAVLTALARTPGWFKVDLHGLQGWIAAMYVEPMGLCG